MTTQSIHHLGLAVADLHATTDFLTRVFGFSVVKQLPDYPANFVSNGHAFLTLWQTDPDATAFDRRSNVGLHHFALSVASEEELKKLYETAAGFPGVAVDFAPEPLGESGAQHAMLFEPGGIRIELIWPGN